MKSHAKGQVTVTDEDILAGCIRRDRAAQHELYARTSDRIYRLLLRLAHNADDAADLLQETYLRVFQHIHRFQGASSLSTWIYRIAVNEARQHRRRQTRQDAFVRDEALLLGEAHGGVVDTAGDRMDVSEAVSRLPDEERTLIVLRYWEDMDYARMAEVLDKPAGTIASGLNRARRMVQDLLGQSTPLGRGP